MSGYLICLVALGSVFGAGMVNWRWSLCLMIAWGYFFGILKAQLVYSGGHFIFDAATLGFYAGLVVKPPTPEEMYAGRDLKPWVVVLIAWPLFMAVVPLQHYLIQLVGLRGNALWLPMILVGTWVDRKALVMLATTLAVMNIVAFAFAMAEYTLGVDYFVPDNEVTQIVFRSNDIKTQEGEATLRIPSIFANAHSYANTMVLTTAWILGCLSASRVVGWFGKPLYIAGLICALLGVFIAGPRLPVATLGILILTRVFTGKVNVGFLILTIILGTGVLYFVMQNERMQRFMELQDVEMVGDRVSASVSIRFFEVVAEFPMGRGMGAGGTSIPYFLQHHLPEGMGMTIENEYGRIVLEQGLPGLLIFLAFMTFWLLKPLDRRDVLYGSKALLWALGLVWLGTMLMGCGAFATIPSAALMLLTFGFIFTKVDRGGLTGAKRRGRSVESLDSSRMTAVGAYQRGLARA